MNTLLSTTTVDDGSVTTIAPLKSVPTIVSQENRLKFIKLLFAEHFGLITAESSQQIEPGLVVHPCISNAKLKACICDYATTNMQGCKTVERVVAMIEAFCDMLFDGVLPENQHFNYAVSRFYNKLYLRFVSNAMADEAKLLVALHRTDRHMTAFHLFEYGKLTHFFDGWIVSKNVNEKSMAAFDDFFFNNTFDFKTLNTAEKIGVALSNYVDEFDLMVDFHNLVQDNNFEDPFSRSSKNTVPFVHLRDLPSMSL
jgi:hypothetical protein